MKEFFKNVLINILWWESKLILAKYKPKIVAITGSVGKTGTKDAVYSVLKRFLSVRKSMKSFNSEIGIPLTILDRGNGWSNPFVWASTILHGLVLIVFPCDYPEWLVLEIGVRKPGDIKSILPWLSTDIVIITRFAETPPHVEFFNSREHLFQEKSELIKSLKKGGKLILNSDDREVIALGSEVEESVISFGLNKEALVRGSDIGISYKEETDLPLGIIFSIFYNNEERKVVIPGVLGENYVYNGLAAVATALSIGIDFYSACDGLGVYEFPPGRMRLIDGVKETCIIDDSYNSSPVAVESALKSLSALVIKGRRIAVLGDMLELGKFTDDAHKKVGEYVPECAEILITVGKRARGIVMGALNFGMNENNIFQFEDSRTAGKFVEGIISAGDVILVKGSQGMRMERTVEEVMANPEQKALLLGRQENEWLLKK